MAIRMMQMILFHGLYCQLKFKYAVCCYYNSMFMLFKLYHRCVIFGVILCIEDVSCTLVLSLVAVFSTKNH